MSRFNDLKQEAAQILDPKVKGHVTRIITNMEASLEQVTQLIGSIKQQEKKARQAKKEEEIRKAKGTTVLVVDDDRLIRNVLERSLLEAGYKVLVAKNGHEALHVYDERSLYISVVIMDVDMPIISGKETTRRLLQAHPDARVVYHTGSEMEPDDLGGAKAFLMKPCAMSDVVAKIEEVRNAEFPYTVSAS
jgi:CheY-like chemotaxis protein